MNRYANRYGSRYANRYPTVTSRAGTRGYPSRPVSNKTHPPTTEAHYEGTGGWDQ